MADKPKPSPKAVEAPELGYGRWMLVDENTGEILDDAQGYGYKSASGAHLAFAYKTMPKKRKRRLASVKRRAERFWEDHPDLGVEMDQAMLWAMKDGEDFTVGDARKIVERSGVELNGLTVAQVMRYR